MAPAPATCSCPVLLDIAAVNMQYLREPERNNQSEVETVEVTKALAALQPLYGKDNVEIITTDGRRIRGTVRSMKTTQALTTPSVKMLCPDGQIVKIPFPTIAEIKSHT
ncbi:MAG TPA: hypothetical protein VLA93_18605 [Pyrinomonadaceae bacterium]|nr:hypothetical protein [Pyrinomonadaceae bacterium]